MQVIEVLPTAFGCAYGGFYASVIFFGKLFEQRRVGHGIQRFALPLPQAFVESFLCRFMIRLSDQIIKLPRIFLKIVELNTRRVPIGRIDRLDLL